MVRGDVRAAVRRLARAGERFDRIFLDPPYASAELPGVLAAIAEGQLVARGGQIVVETARRDPLPSIPGLATLDDRRYGDTVVTRLVPADGEDFEKEAEPQDELGGRQPRE